MDAHKVLNANGFPTSDKGGYTEAVKRFQTAYCGPGGWLAIDGVVGPKTEAVLRFLPKLSTHFQVSELACKHCGRCYVHRELLSALEKLREKYGRPITLLSGYRCPTHNKAVGGASDSQHVHGRAVDPVTMIPFDYVRKINRFSGIGTRGAYAAHYDVRIEATPQNPARWVY